MVVLRTVRIDKLIVRAANRSDCAHGCRYCPIRRKQSPIALERYEAFVTRVKAWLAGQAEPWGFFHSLGYHHDHDREDLEALRRLDGEAPMRGITLGGLRWRGDADLEAWFGLMRDYGLQTVHATFGGVGAVHDRWNNKAGNYDLLLRSLHVAGGMGMKLGQRMLVGRSTLDSLEPLLEVLERLPKHAGDWRYAMPFFYQTERQKAQPDIEADRIDEAGRERLPVPVRALYGEINANLSEREWIARFEAGGREADRATLVIRLGARTIDELERRPVEEIVEELSAQTRAAYAAMPSFEELMARHGDRSDTRIYATSRCVEMKWLDAWRRDHPEADFDQSLTHCWFGG